LGIEPVLNFDLMDQLMERPQFKPKFYCKVNPL